MIGFKVPKSPKYRMVVNENNRAKIESLIFINRKTGKRSFVDGLTLFNSSDLPSYVINVSFAMLCYNGGLTSHQIDQINRLKSE